MIPRFPLDIIYGILIMSYSSGYSQGHEPAKDQEDNSHEFKRNRVALIMGHGHVFGAVDASTGKTVVTIPTWGIDYQYWLNHKFGIGFKADIEIMDYVVETGSQQELERNNPVILSAVALFNPFGRGYLLVGPGIEIEQSHNLFVLRFGAGYEFEVGHNWDFAPEILFDLKDGAIGAFTWGIGVGKRF